MQARRRLPSRRQPLFSPVPLSGSARARLADYLQGDEDLHRTLPSAQRAALRHDPRVTKQLERFWAVFRADATITKEQYLAVHAKFAMVLIPDLAEEQVVESGEEDWLADAGGAAQMDRTQFMDCLFELCDMYTTGIDGGSYAEWLRRLFKRITVKCYRYSDGVVERELPRAPTRARQEEYAEFRLARGLGVHASRVPGAATGKEVVRVAEAADEEEDDEDDDEEEDEEEEDDEDDEDMGGGELTVVTGMSPAAADSTGSASSGARESTGAAEAEEEEVTFEWADDAQVFPMVLYSDGPIASAEDEGEDEGVGEGEGGGGGGERGGGEGGGEGGAGGVGGIGAAGPALPLARANCASPSALRRSVAAVRGWAEA